MKLTVDNKTYKVLIEVKSKEKKVLAGVGVVLTSVLGFFPWYSEEIAPKFLQFFSEANRREWPRAIFKGKSAKRRG